MTIKVDLSLPTDRQLTSRRPDIVLFLKEDRCIVILECAVAWELLLEEREREKFYKYQELAADLATQHHGWRVVVVPIVIGSLGTLRSLRQNLNGLALFTQREVNRLAKELQFEVLCSAVRIIRRHLERHKGTRYRRGVTIMLSTVKLLLDLFGPVGTRNGRDKENT